MKFGIYLAGAAALALSACGSEAPAPEADTAEMPTATTQDQVASNATPAPEAAAPAEPAQIDGITNKRLSFAAGTSSARVESSITGDETIDYLLNVRAGQSMNISMASSNLSAYFNLLEPGETEVAVFNGSMGENMFEGVAAKSGDYRIRVYLYRNAARRGEKAPYTLEAAVN